MAIEWQGADQPQAETFPHRSPAENLPSKPPGAIVLPRVISVSPSCTVIQGSPKRSSSDNPLTARDTLEMDLRRLISDATKSLQEKTPIEFYMLSIAKDYISTEIKRANNRDACAGV